MPKRLAFLEPESCAQPGTEPERRGRKRRSDAEEIEASGPDKTVERNERSGDESAPWDVIGECHRMGIPEHRARPDYFPGGTPIQGGQQVEIREPPGETWILERVHFGQVYAMAREDPEHRIKLCRQREREYRTDTKGVPRLPGDDMQGGDEAERQQCHLEDLQTGPPVRGEHTEANDVPDCANLLRWNKKYTILALLTEM